MKKKISKEVKIGISFLICIFILYFGISFLKGINIFKPTNSYMVVFDDVSGLVQSSPVLVNGYKVGSVYSMEIDPQNPRRVLAIMNLDKGFKISKGSSVEIDVSVLGSSDVVIKPNYSATEYYSTTDTIRGKKEKGVLESFSGDLMPQISILLPRIDSILTGLQYAVNNPAINQSLVNVETMTSQLQASTKSLNNLLTALNKDVPSITSNMADATQNISDITGQFKDLDIEKTYKSVDATLKNIEALSSRINSTDNSVGLLLNDRQLYDSINSTLNNASMLLRDVKENPSRYINVKVF